MREIKPEMEMSFNGLLTGMLRREIAAILGKTRRQSEAGCRRGGKVDMRRVTGERAVSK